MNKQTFIGEIEAMLELQQGQLQLQQSLNAYQAWDSMTQLALIAYIDTHFQHTLELSEMEKIQTASDILSVVQPYLTS